MSSVTCPPRNQCLIYISELLHSSYTREYGPIYDEMLTFGFALTASEQRLKEQWGLGISFIDNSFEAINALTWPHAASHARVDNTIDNDFYPKDYITKFSETHALNDLAVSHSILDVLKELNDDQF